VRIDLGSRHVDGTAIDIDVDGSLVIRTADGSTERLSSGEVIHLR